MNKSFSLRNASSDTPRSFSAFRDPPTESPSVRRDRLREPPYRMFVAIRDPWPVLPVLRFFAEPEEGLEPGYGVKPWPLRFISTPERLRRREPWEEPISTDSESAHPILPVFPSFLVRWNIFHDLRTRNTHTVFLVTSLLRCLCPWNFSFRCFDTPL